MLNEKFLIIDTETTNSLDCPLAYDIGFAVIDKKGRVYDSFSFVVSEIFLDTELMKYAYFKEKIPQYYEDIRSGKRILASMQYISEMVQIIMTKYGISAIVAHNANFDYRALNFTQRYITKSKVRYFFPYGTKIWDTYKMSKEVIFWDDDYCHFCTENHFNRYGGKRCHYVPLPKLTAEVLYRYITKDIEFQEKHTALEDVMIEKEIFAECFRRNPEINGALWE